MTPEYFAVVREVLENDLLIQAGRGHDLPPMSEVMQIATLAYQRAQNRVSNEDAKDREAEMKRGRM